MSEMFWQIPEVAALNQQIHAAAAAVDSGHQQSLALAQQSAEHWGGSGSEEFQQVISTINHHYGTLGETIKRAAVTLDSASDGTQHNDAAVASQFL
ncbi:hypothetical protein KIH27_20605 [Mycobacterium sp. M1]|uniref:ESAT-6-like protein n=1 Tax=Mycolicibacter acidiphilus TaxID=2835306 RepID=A0ABS5RQZ7_9MYCO|nr:hypothetical protein [Mycolicibacter acidiphilus]MBS9535988.1 hypothetical protein [Mycolicibacter acidiphilus]